MDELIKIEITRDQAEMLVSLLDKEAVAKPGVQTAIYIGPVAAIIVRAVKDAGDKPKDHG